MAEIRRMTTLYIQAEDRFLLRAELDTEASVDLWLTLRLLQRLLPMLLGWLEGAEGQEPTEVKAKAHQALSNAFAQQVAREALSKEPPVEALADTESWVVQSIDLSHTAQSMRLLFKGAADQPDQTVGVALAALPLRQWLNIVCDGYQQAEWPMQHWPDWMLGQATPTSTGAVLH